MYRPGRCPVKPRELTDIRVIVTVSGDFIAYDHHDAPKAWLNGKCEALSDRVSCVRHGHR